MQIIWSSTERDKGEYEGACRETDKEDPTVEREWVGPTKSRCHGGTPGENDAGKQQDSGDGNLGKTSCITKHEDCETIFAGVGFPANYTIFFFLFFIIYNIYIIFGFTKKKKKTYVMKANVVNNYVFFFFFVIY